jgi:hypothetical protein
VQDDDDFDEGVDVLSPIELVTAMLMTEWDIDERRARMVFDYLADQAGLDRHQAAVEYMVHGQMRPTI